MDFQIEKSKDVYDYLKARFHLKPSKEEKNNSDNPKIS